MKRLPKGLTHVSKEEFIHKTLLLKEELELIPSDVERIGVEWSKSFENKQPKKSIRW